VSVQRIAGEMGMFRQQSLSERPHSLVWPFTRTRSL
jgi:hypothetical protein